MLREMTVCSLLKQFRTEGPPHFTQPWLQPCCSNVLLLFILGLICQPYNIYTNTWDPPYKSHRLKKLLKKAEKLKYLEFITVKNTNSHI